MQERPTGDDPEDVVEIAFEPPTVVLPPGRREIVAGRRPRRAAVVRPAQAAGAARSASAPDSPPAMATFVQRPRIGRWLLSLLGLVTAAAIFAVVLSTVADRLVDESSVDADAARQGARPSPAAAAAGWRR